MFMSNQVSKQVEAMIAGQFRTEAMPWEQLTHLSRAIVPGSISILCGTPGASKTFMLLQCLSYWSENNIPAIVYALENYKEYHLLRMLAQYTETAGLTDDEWVRANPDIARSAASDNQDYLERMGKMIMCNANDLPTLSELAVWVQMVAEAGQRIICIDPITIAAKEQGQSFEYEEAFIKAVSRTCSKYKCTLLLVTHPIKGKPARPDISFLSGSAAFSRFTETVLWLEFHNEKVSNVRCATGTDTLSHDRTVHILKARNGKGQGCRLAYTFSNSSLKLIEKGLIVRKS